MIVFLISVYVLKSTRFHSNSHLSSSEPGGSLGILFPPGMGAPGRGSCGWGSTALEFGGRALQVVAVKSCPPTSVPRQPQGPRSIFLALIVVKHTHHQQQQKSTILTMLKRMVQRRQVRAHGRAITITVYFQNTLQLTKTETLYSPRPSAHRSSKQPLCSLNL